MPDQALDHVYADDNAAPSPDQVGLADVLARPLPPGGPVLLKGFTRPDDRNSTVYVSTPITTGLAYLRWLADNRAAPRTATAAQRSLVIRRNIAEVAPLVRAISSAGLGSHVIDPTELEDVPGWEQVDYHRFWAEVVAFHVSHVVFADGWQYSTGCTLEFGVAALTALPLHDADLAPLKVDCGLVLLQRARPLLARAGASTCMQDSVVAEVTIGLARNGRAGAARE